MRVRLQDTVRLVLAALLSVAAAQGSARAAWPQLTFPPKPIEAVPEMLDAREAQKQDSIRILLGEILCGPSVPAPPQEPSPALVEWLITCASFGDSMEVSALGEKSPPGAWAAADPEGRLILPIALALAEGGKAPAALHWLTDGSVVADEKPYVALLRLELMDRAGDSTGAGAFAIELRDGSGGQDWTRPAYVRILRERERMGDPEGLLRESLRMSRDLGSDPEETAARVRALRALDRHAAARAVADTLFDRYPGTRTARLEALQRLRDWAGKVPEGEARAIFPVLLRHQRFSAAESLLASIPDSDSLRIVYLESLLAARLYREVLRDSLDAGAVEGAALRARLLLVRARAARNSLQWGPMATFYGAAAAMGGETRTTAWMEWAREAESHQREPTADSLYTLLLEIPAQAAEARFRRALARYALGRTSDALEDLRAGDDSAGRNGGFFWRARLAEQVGDTAEARAARRALAARDGYYASRARREIALRESGAAAEDFWTAEKGRAFRPSGVGAIESRAPCGNTAPWERRAARIRLFRRFGRNAWGEREQRLLEGELPVEGRADALLCLGLPDQAVRVAIAHSSSDPLLRYPRPYAWCIAHWAERAGVAADLVWAVARRESLFDPAALSGAGARGVLQLMEATAAEEALRWGVPAGPLARADVNIALGVLHLSDLGEQVDWPLPALLASYNAGALKTAEWVERFPDPDFFIERVGWRETRDYMRHVLDGTWTYREAYGLEGPILERRERSPFVPEGEE